MRRHLPVLVLAAVLLAGCNVAPFGGAGGPTDTERLTAVPVTTDEPPATVSVDGPRPDWLAPDGTVRVDVLRRGHRDAIADVSYTWTFRMHRDERGAVMGGNEIVRRVRTNGTATMVEQDGATLTSNPPIYVTRVTDYTYRGVGFRRVAAAQYVDGTTAVRRVATSDSTQVTRVDAAARETYAFTPEVLDRYLGGGVTVEASVARADGQRLYRLYVPPGDPPTTLNRSAGPASRVWNYTATAYVTGEGFVRTLVVGYDQRSATQNHRVSIRMEYGRVGSTAVERPEWAAPSTQTPAGTPAPAGTSTRAGEANAPNGTGTPAR
ncbi:MAG: hypothetical protein ABEJ26_01595 [Halosimplex sp.]